MSDGRRRVLWLSTAAFTLLFNVWLMLGVLGIPLRAVGGVVGMLGALGGFFLPPAFGMVGRWSGIPQLAFLVLLALTVWSLVWLHIAVMRVRGVSLLLDPDDVPSSA